MVVLDGNFALGCGPETYYPYIHTSQCMLKRTDAIMKEVLESITFVSAYPTVYAKVVLLIRMGDRTGQRGMQNGAWCSRDKWV
jgi:hypothetical protein